MNLTDILLLLFIIFLIIISGMMSGSETALTAVSKPRITSKVNQGSKRAAYVKNLIDNKDNVISSLLLSNNLVNILASSLATAYLYDLFGASGILYATIIMTSLIVIFAEVLPKIYSINRPNRTAIFIGPTIFYLNKLVSPLVYIINFISKTFLKNIIKKSEQTIEEESEEELKGMIDLYQTSNPDSEHEKEMLQSILTLNDTTVEEVFTHRKNIYSINIDSDIQSLIKKLNSSNYTRIPFWKNNPENIIGVLDTRLFEIDITIKDSLKEKIIKLLKKPWFIPETTNLLDQLVAFKNKKEHLTLVVDEYGELLGLITLEDIIEEIVGEIEDEHHQDNDPRLICNADGSFDADARFPIDLLETELGANLTITDGEDIDTLGGLVFSLAGRVPIRGELIRHTSGIEFEVIDADPRRIKSLRILGSPRLTSKESKGE